MAGFVFNVQELSKTLADWLETERESWKGIVLMIVMTATSDFVVDDPKQCSSLFGFSISAYFRGEK
jgi:hypothetical protein